MSVVISFDRTCTVRVASYPRSAFRKRRRYVPAQVPHVLWSSSVTGLSLSVMLTSNGTTTATVPATPSTAEAALPAAMRPAPETPPRILKPGVTLGGRYPNCHDSAANR